MPRSIISELYDKTFSFIRNCQTAFQSGCAICIPTSNEGEFTAVAPCPGHHFGVLRIPDFCHSNRCVVVSHCLLNLNFPEDIACGTSFHMLICLVYIFLGLQIFFPLASWVVLLLCTLKRIHLFIGCPGSLLLGRLSAVVVHGLLRTGSVIVVYQLSHLSVCGIVPGWGSNPCLLNWQADSLPLSHQGSPPDRILLRLPCIFWITVLFIRYFLPVCVLSFHSPDRIFCRAENLSFNEVLFVNSLFHGLCLWH